MALHTWATDRPCAASTSVWRNGQPRVERFCKLRVGRRGAAYLTSVRLASGVGQRCGVVALLPRIRWRGDHAVSCVWNKFRRLERSIALRWDRPGSARVRGHQGEAAPGGTNGGGREGGARRPGPPAKGSDFGYVSLPGRRA